MKIFRLAVLLCAGWLVCLSQTRAAPNPDPQGRTGTKAKDSLFATKNLFAWCIVPFDAKKRGPEVRAAMLERLGLRSLAYDYRAEHVATFDAEMEALVLHQI